MSDTPKAVVIDPLEALARKVAAMTPTARVKELPAIIREIAKWTAIR
jgi:hypothetical protein